MEFSENKINEIRNIVENKYKTKYPDKMDRYNHILGVAKMAKYLSNIYNIDSSRAEICGLVHDYYKYESEDEMKKLINPKDAQECAKYPVLYHSYASAESLENVFGIIDPEMKSAIRNHVFGHTNMTRLEEIVLISDYTEENRKYDDCIKVRNVLLSGDLNQAIYDSTKYVINFLNKKNIVPHPMQYEVLNEYERKIKNE
ncbi:MAG: bis(5'-nucleosyl)-tetraphosphatase (symmetrical) YqeK [Acholeplasmatales bacterium]|nr:bis(5'-nucleosyl)-tetraphosphatase (symmetrical) YqeK [Acholeplasmatales bacterium]